MPKKQTTKKTTANKSTTTRKRSTTSGRSKSKKMTIVNSGEMDHMIREKAYELYMQRGATHGGDFDDWLKAEQEVKKELSHV